ncbi:coiled-coil domain-containing protein 149 [Zootermopsis nevadensis]|uniref:coiled-coil domain-containing protein 149 n=1 Tax=Zootermopsis nevadensis TaxID=136037 RepID=UPI000B8E5027|nr:coiled-coil domain-containing protein 149 [Zootermopsis nevadensis]
MANAPGNVGFEEYVDNFLAENSALRRKLQSKSEALLILSKDLDQCRTERDQFKLMAEQLQDRYSMLKKKSHDMGFNYMMFYPDGVDSSRCGKSLAQVLGESTEQNKALRIELEDLRQKLRDAHGDIKVLRLSLGQQRPGTNVGENQAFPAHQREDDTNRQVCTHSAVFICQVSNCVVLQCTQMRTDLQAVLDEKEELVTERDAYKCKVHRLNHELNALLKGDSKKLVDVDSLVMENRYLKERLQQAEEEKDMSNQALSKYKSMLDKKRSKGTVKLGTNNTGMVMSHKQVQQLLERGTSAQLPNTAATLSDLKSLCLALLEALGDKVLALAHQKKANRILASRISDLELAAQSGRVAAFPSQLLLEGYASSEVDREVGHIVSAERLDGSDSEGECITSIHLNTRHPEGAPAATEINPGGSQSDVTSTDRVEVSKAPSVSRPSVKDHTVTAGRESWQHLSGRHTVRGPYVEDAVSRQTCVPGQDDGLPPQLQHLVQKALNEMKQEAKNGC